MSKKVGVCAICLTEAPLTAADICSKCVTVRNQLRTLREQGKYEEDVIVDRFNNAIAFPEGDEYMNMILGLVKTEKNMRGRITEKIKSKEAARKLVKKGSSRKKRRIDDRYKKQNTGDFIAWVAPLRDEYAQISEGEYGYGVEGSYYD